QRFPLIGKVATYKRKKSSLSHADEYRMQINPRDHLESGLDYRSIRAGPGFTRRVMRAIEDEAAAQAPSPPSAGLIALLAAAGIIAVIVIVTIIWYRGSPVQPNSTELPNIVFAQTTVATDFTQ